VKRIGRRGVTCQTWGGPLASLAAGPVAVRLPLRPSADFSLDRCADVYLVTDALGAHAEWAAESASISVPLKAHDQLLEFALSPLRTGTSRRLDPGAPGPRRPESLASLTDELSVSEVNGHELLRAAMRDHRLSR